MAFSLTFFLPLELLEIFSSFHFAPLEDSVVPRILTFFDPFLCLDEAPGSLSVNFFTL